MKSKSFSNNSTPSGFQTPIEIFENSSLSHHLNVDNVDKDITNNVETINVNVNNKNREEKMKFIARDLATKLDDLKSLNYYLKIVKDHKPEFIYECLSITTLAYREGKIRKTPAKYFVGVIKRRSGK